MDPRQYLRHFMLLVSGSAAGQLVNLASYPFLARLYSPEDFGGFAIFVAASSIPAAVACARYELAIPTVPNHSRFAMLWLSFSVAAGVAVAAGAASAAYWLSMEASGALMLAALLAFAVGITGFSNATSLFLMRHDQYRVTSTSIFVRTAAGVLVQLAFAFVLRDARGLIIGYCAGLLAQAAILTPPLRREIASSRPRIRQMRVMAARYRRQVSADVPGTLFGAWAHYAPPFFIQFLFGPAAVGFYAVAQRIALLPIQLFTDALSRVFFQKAARAQQESGSFWQETKFSLLVSGSLATVLLCAIFLFARPVITVYLGADWDPAATILIILAPMLALRSLVMSIATIAFVVKRAYWLLLHNIASMVILIVTFLMVYFTGTSLEIFMIILAVLSGIELAVFGTLLIQAARTGAERKGAAAGG